MTGISLLLSIALISCGYVKKDEFDKQLTDQKTGLEQKIQLAQDSAAAANDKADKVLATTKEEIGKLREDIDSVDQKNEAAMVAMKGSVEDTSKETERIAEEAANKALAEAKAAAIAEDEKVKQEARDAADKAMNAAKEADRRAQEAAKEAEVAKQLPKIKEPTVFTVYFDAGKIDLKQEGIAELEKAASMIKDNPDATVKIEGHTDNQPLIRSIKYGNNWGLSQARAQAVKNYLVDKLGVPASCIKEALGIAFYKPVAPNDAKNRWQNRRVEVIVVTP